MHTALNQGYAYRELLGADAEALTVLDYLSRRYRHSSRAVWEDHLAAGRVLINGRAVPADAVLRAGCELVWNRPPWSEPDAPCSFDVLYEDRDLLAVAKPAGLPTLPGGNFLQRTLLHKVREYSPAASPLHRLGRWTSGIVLCAKNNYAGAELTRQWSAKEVGKRYRALASGLPAWNELAISTPIGTAPHSLLGTVHAASADGRPSLSRAIVLERGQDQFLCDVRIATGRPHQIRIHLASTGHPLVGDPLYGPGGIPLPGTAALPGDPGYLLHAVELGFRHPATGKAMVIECELPMALRSADTHRSLRQPWTNRSK